MTTRKVSRVLEHLVLQNLSSLLRSLVCFYFRWCNIFGILQNRRFGGGTFLVKPVFHVSVLVLNVYSTGSIGIFGAFYFR